MTTTRDRLRERIAELLDAFESTVREEHREMNTEEPDYFGGIAAELNVHGARSELLGYIEAALTITQDDAGGAK